MNYQGKNTHANIHHITVNLRSLLNRLASKSSEPGKLMQWLDKTSHLLGYAFVGTPDYNFANSRIQKAKRYLESSESGAAKYEIRLLVSALRTHLESLE